MEDGALPSVSIDSPSDPSDVKISSAKCQKAWNAHGLEARVNKKVYSALIS
jgi:hypothetical protein